MEILKTIYKRTSSGAIQIWYGELDGGGRYRTSSGQQHGAITTSEWTQCEAKNVGRSNATTAIEQARAELEAMYTKRLEREYHEDIADIDKKRFVKPMLADKWKDRKHKIPTGSVIFIQPKLDGMRAIAQASSLTKSGVAFTSRDGKLIPGAQHLEEHLAPLFERNPDLLLDGELYNHDYKDKFEQLISALKREPKNEEERQRARSVVQYHVYDLPSESSSNFAVRFAALSELFENEPELRHEFLREVPTYSVIWGVEDAAEKFDSKISEFLDAGYEGGIARLNTPYEFKRSKGLLKVKDFMDEEFEIVDIVEGKGNWTGYAKTVFIKLPNGETSKATVKGNQEYCKRLLEQRNDAIGKMGTVTFFRYTNYGVPYLPVFKGVRWDDARNG
jgi:DNA ligase-1